jgi:hypothetical protein
MTFICWLNNNHKTLISLAKKIDKVNGEEVLSFTLEKFLTRPDNTFLDNLEDNDKLKYISRTLKIQATSKESQFYRQFRRFTILQKDVILELEDIQYEENEIEVEKVEFINEQLKLLPWFSSLLFKRYIEKNYSAQTLANELLIPLSTVQYHIRKVRNTIKNNWNLKNNNGMSV